MSATALPSTGLEAGRWEPCSDRSADRADPLAGTAGFGERWLLVEIDGSWGRHAFLESRLDPTVGRALVRRAEAAGIRPVAIRRPGRRADERRATTGWRWAVADVRPGREGVRWGFAAEAEDLLTVPLDPVPRDAAEADAVDRERSEVSSAPIYLVCAHARHDQCCAVKGRPVVTSLAAAYPEETWECSHLGGDRFAATMLLLPQGLSYGRVTAGAVFDIVGAASRGLVLPALYRGRTALTMPVQAAQAFARAAFGDDGIDAWPPLGENRQEAPAGTLVHVRLGASGGQPQVTVTMRETLSDPLLSTCTATIAAPVRQFALVAIEPRRR